MAEVFRLAVGVGYRGIVSFSDPNPRYDDDTRTDRPRTDALHDRPRRRSGLRAAGGGARDAHAREPAQSHRRVQCDCS